MVIRRFNIFLEVLNVDMQEKMNIGVAGKNR